MVEGSASLIVSVTALIILQIASAAKEIDLFEVVREKPRTPGEVLQIRIDLINRVDPKMGRFAFLHLANAEIIVFVLAVLDYQASSLLGDLSPLLAILWIILPYLEIDEFDSLTTHGYAMRSIIVHTLGIIIIAIVGIVIRNNELHPVVSGVPIELLKAGAALLVAIHGLLFLSALRNDLERFSHVRS
ncbi:hypothetical protein [Halorubellus sp. PRR65]|uniref:hypothetical protein n=1 Tax=Halorubellus sp. PRR65 TaxID=3098148 RepID=UPI002B2611E7|nr:hypothetical protein [Halorubellus sp. PRR65]